MQDAVQARAVFVDPTGRRSRVVARSCWALGTLGLAYVALVLVSLLLPPGLSRLTVPGLGAVLPGPAAAPLGAVQGDAPEVLLGPTTRPARSATASPRPRASTTTAGSMPTPTGGAPSPSSTAMPRPTTASTRAPTVAPGRPTTAPTRPTQAPTAPPGSSRTPKPRPSPTRGPR